MARVTLMTVAVYLSKDDRGPNVVYRVVARSAREAAELILDYVGERDPWARIDVTTVTSDGVEGPPRVVGPVGEGGFERQPTSKH